MPQKTLAAQKRMTVRKGDAGRLRRDGKIPAVIYGHTAPEAICIDEREFNTKFHVISESTIITIDVGDEHHDVLVKDFQENVISGKILHIDFYEIERGKSLKTHVPLHLTGVPVGVKLGGVLETFLHELEIECLPKDLPERMEVEIGHLDVGHSIHVSEIQVPENVRVLNSPEQVACLVTHVRVQLEEPVAEEEAEEAEATEGESEEAASEEQKEG